MSTEISGGLFNGSNADMSSFKWSTASMSPLAAINASADTEVNWKDITIIAFSMYLETLSMSLG